MKKGKLAVVCWLCLVLVLVLPLVVVTLFATQPADAG